MSPRTFQTRKHRLAAFLLLSIHLSGCTQWAPVTQPIPEAVEKHPKADIRITLQDGKQIELGHVRLVPDSLIGLNLVGSSESGVPEPWDKPDTVAVALADISRMELQKGSGAATGIIAGVVLLAVIVGVVVSQAIENSDMGM